MEFEVGQTVYVKKIGNAARYLNQTNAPIDDYIVEATVAKIGRKYFYLEGNWRTAFRLGNGIEVNGVCANYAVHLSKQEIYDKEEASDLAFEISRRFRYSRDLAKFGLEALREIMAVIDKYEEAQ